MIWPEMGTPEDILRKIIHNPAGGDIMKVWCPVGSIPFLRATPQGREASDDTR